MFDSREDDEHKGVEEIFKIFETQGDFFSYGRISFDSIPDREMPLIQPDQSNTPRPATSVCEWGT